MRVLIQRKETAGIETMNIKKLAIGFAVFMGYYIAARIVERKLEPVQKLIASV